MSSLDDTLAGLAPRVSSCRNLSGRYNPRHCLAIYHLPIAGHSLSAPCTALGEAVVARNGLGCVLLEGVPARIPEGAVVIALYNAAKLARPDLLEGVPELTREGQYAIKLQDSALITSRSRDGLAAGIQTLAMLILRHSEDILPAGIVVDTPTCQFRGLAVELGEGGVNLGLLMQIASFAATFKANRLQLILPASFVPPRRMPGLDNFVQLCQSYGLALGVSAPWLGAMLSGKRSPKAIWADLRAAARFFGAEQAALDDPLPIGVDASRIKLAAASILNGEAGLKSLSLDANLLQASNCPPPALKSLGVGGWYRMDGIYAPPPPDFGELPLRLEVQGPINGFSGQGSAVFHHRLDSAMIWLRSRPRRDFMISFRDAGFAYLWQNLMYPAATGLISAWGNPLEADQSAWLYANLLYNHLASPAMDLWEAVAEAFPPGLSATDELLLRRIVFGHWPEDRRALWLLNGIDWLKTLRGVEAARGKLNKMVEALDRNAATLDGARLGLRALVWLASFATLIAKPPKPGPAGSPPDGGRDKPAIAESLENFNSWSGGLQELLAVYDRDLDSLPLLKDMRDRLESLGRDRG
ncbi:MAG: hypothetical protein LBU64_11400 [Planctomycetota bacterium]|jgi:hypothetical protein|nr:hypothetical protein [Planctomycetota bacterium]